MFELNGDDSFGYYAGLGTQNIMWCALIEQRNNVFDKNKIFLVRCTCKNNEKM